MDILKHMLARLETWRQAWAEREALRLLVARKDSRLLRDAGLDLFEASAAGCEPLPQAKERRWTAPLVRLPRYGAFSPARPPASCTSLRNSAR